MLRLIDRFLAALVLVVIDFIMRLLPDRFFAGIRSRAALLWFDQKNLAVPVGAVTDTSFGMVRYFDDFHRKVIDSATASLYTVNSDTGGTAFAINEQHNGVIRGTGDGTDGDFTSIFGPPIWRADAGGPLIFETRATLITSLANGEEFIGCSDDDGTDENPITVSTTDVVTTNASNAAGFAFTGAGTADWKMVSVNGDADGSVARANANGVTTPVLTTWQTFKLAINRDGDVDYYIDGVFQGRENAAVSPTTLLAWAVAQQDGGAARSTDIDYVWISAARR